MNLDILGKEPVLLPIDIEQYRFDITNDAANINEMSDRLANLAKSMVHAIQILNNHTNRRFDRKFRMEFLPASFYQNTTVQSNNNHWELRINLDPVTWFDWKWSNASSDDDQKAVLGIARNYANKYKTFVPEEYLEAPKQRLIEADYRGNSISFQCNENLTKQPSNFRSCNLKINAGNTVAELHVSKCK